MKPCIIIIRGLPGSGKSTLADVLTKIYPNLRHVENDMFRNDGGNYTYSDDDYYTVRDMAMRITTDLLQEGHSVVVSNVFTKESSMQRYINLNYATMVIRTTGEYGSVHDVPKEHLDSIRNNFQDIDNEIIVGDMDKISIASMRNIIETNLGPEI